MVKKIMLWTTYVLIVGLLIFGAANRTSAKTDQGILFGRIGEITDERGRGNGNPDSLVRFGDFDSDEHEEIIDEGDWVVLGGEIISFGSETLEIRTTTAGILEIEGRTWRFVLESGYVPVEGNQVIVQGFYENGEFEAAGFQDLAAENTIQIRDEYGKPMWGGGGRN